MATKTISNSELYSLLMLSEKVCSTYEKYIRGNQTLSQEEAKKYTQEHIKYMNIHNRLFEEVKKRLDKYGEA